MCIFLAPQDGEQLYFESKETHNCFLLLEQHKNGAWNFEFTEEMLVETTNAIATLTSGADTLFLLLGAIMVLAMHAGFAFLELGTVRNKNQVNALVKIITDFGVSTIAYFFIGYYLICINSTIYPQK